MYTDTKYWRRLDGLLFVLTFFSFSHSTCIHIAMTKPITELTAEMMKSLNLD